MPGNAATPWELPAQRDAILAAAASLATQDPILRELPTLHPLDGLIVAIEDSLTHPQAVGFGPDDLLRRAATDLADASTNYSAASLQALYLSEAVWDWIDRTYHDIDSERASRLALAVGWVLRQSGIRKLEEADRLRFRDDLTTLLNRIAFDRDLASALTMASEDEPVVVVVIDIDGLKEINDRQGHLAGNRLLREFAGLLGGVQGSAGSAYRWAGDEFAVLFRRTSLTEARETMAAAMAVSKIGFSWGASSATDRDVIPQSLVESADAQMYEMKAIHKGRLRRWRASIAGLMRGRRLRHDQ